MTFSVNLSESSSLLFAKSHNIISFMEQPKQNKKSFSYTRTSERDKQIIQTSLIGIIANIALSAFKATVGLMSNSIAIFLDAVNNLSDAASSLITIVGTKLAAKSPDKKHPFGYGRVEYLSAMIISVLILYAGITSLVESVKKIFKPQTPEYSTVTIIIVASAIIVKIALGLYVKKMGKKTNSDALENSGQDALFDSIISASTLAAAFIFLWKGISIESWLGAIISLFIIKAGFEMFGETVSKILGESADFSLVRGIKSTIKEFNLVNGAYDLILNNYGPNSYTGSVHIEVPDTLCVDELDELTRSITEKVYEKHHVVLTAIGVYSVNTKTNESAEIRDKVYGACLTHKYVVQSHGFYLDKQRKTIRFDMVVSFEAPNRNQVYDEVHEHLRNLFPDFTFQIAMDIDFS